MPENTSGKKLLGIVKKSSKTSTNSLRKETIMSLLPWLKNWKALNELWYVLEPFIINLAEKNVPRYIRKLYENLTKTTQPVLDSLKKLKEKIKTSPNALDDYCFNQGVNAIETFANHLLAVVADLRK